MAVLREIVAKYDIKFDDKNFKKADKSIGGAIKGLKLLGGAVAVAFATRAISTFVSEIIKAGDSIDKVSSKLGLTTDALQELRFAAGLTGVKVEQFDVGFQRFTRRLAEAAKGTGTALKTFKELGIQLKDSNGNLRAADDVLGDVADSIAATESQADRVRIAFKFFDTEGVNLVNTLSGGRKGLEEMRLELRELGGVMSKELIEQSVELTDDLFRFNMTMLGIKQSVALVVLPAINRMVRVFTKANSKFNKLAESSNIVQAAFVVLGAAAAVLGTKLLFALGPLLLPFIKIALAIGFVVIVVDELITLFQGGETVIGSFIDAMFGVGASAKMVEFLKQAWQGLISVIADAFLAIDQFFTFMSESFAEGLEGYNMFVDDMANGMNNLVNGFTDVWSGFFTWVENTWNSFSNAIFDSIPEPLKKILGLAGKGTEIVIKGIGAAGGEFVRQATSRGDIEKSRRDTATARTRVGRERAFSGPSQNVAGVRSELADRRKPTVRRTIPSPQDRRAPTVRRTIPTPRATAAGASTEINQNNNFSMNVSTQGQSPGVNALTRAGNAMSKTAAKHTKRATLEAVKQRAGT